MKFQRDWPGKEEHNLETMNAIVRWRKAGANPGRVAGLGSSSWGALVCLDATSDDRS